MKLFILLTLLITTSRSYAANVYYDCQTEPHHVTEMDDEEVSIQQGKGDQVPAVDQTHVKVQFYPQSGTIFYKNFDNGKTLTFRNINRSFASRAVWASELYNKLSFTNLTFSPAGLVLPQRGVQGVVFSLYGNLNNSPRAKIFFLNTDMLGRTQVDTSHFGFTCTRFSN